MLVTLFLIIFWLLYNLASFWYENKKITNEIEEIQLENENNTQKIEEKKKRLEYLQTPQRIDKEAKMQMNRKQEGEEVLILIEEKIDIIPSRTKNRTEEHVQKEFVPIFDKWKWIFFGQR
jgi:cbb3-type cytochrome oxidase subunit 3